MTRGEHLAVALAVVAAMASSARAQSAEAEVLFREGRKLIKDGNLAAGCDKLAASERIETSIGTLLNLGDCKEKLGKLASAWGAFTKAEAIARRSGDDKRQAEAHKRAAAIEPRVAKLVIEVTRKVDGLVIRRDGEIVEPAMWQVAVPVDPGTYAISAEAPGYIAWHGEVVIERAGPTIDGRRVITVPSLERILDLHVDSPPAALQPVLHMREPERTHETFTGMRKLSVGLAVAGAGVIGGGVYFSFHARELEDEADKLCPTTSCSDSMALRLNRDAESAAKTANILYIAGGSSLAAAVVLWLVGGPGDDRSTIVPTFGSGRVGLAYERSL